MITEERITHTHIEFYGLWKHPDNQITQQAVALTINCKSSNCWGWALYERRTSLLCNCQKKRSGECLTFWSFDCSVYTITCRFLEFYKDACNLLTYRKHKELKILFRYRKKRTRKPVNVQKTQRIKKPCRKHIIRKFVNVQKTQN